jgi:hypothetical protein
VLEQELKSASQFRIFKGARLSEWRSRLRSQLAQLREGFGAAVSFAAPRQVDSDTPLREHACRQEVEGGDGFFDQTLLVIERVTQLVPHYAAGGVGIGNVCDCDSTRPNLVGAEREVVDRLKRDLAEEDASRAYLIVECFKFGSGNSAL